MNLRFFFTVFSTFLVVSSLRAGTLTIWPSDEADVRKHNASEISVDTQRVVRVHAGVGYNWPGVTIFFKQGERDLSAYGVLRVTVRNVDTRSLIVSLSVKNRDQKGHAPGGNVLIQPGEKGVIVANLRQTPWVLDKSLDLVGMRGFPAAIEGGSFNIRKTAELHVFLNKLEMPATFEVLKVEAEEKPLALMKAEGFLPFVDMFGQFVHADWPGKVHSETELQAAKEREMRELAESKGPDDRNAWGGWTKGPLLKATGHFRTEKVNGKWWLVDPDGRLFFSHGVDCVRPSSDTGISDREKYFSWLPEKDSPFAAFYGSSSWAPHGFYKDRGKFKTFDFSRSNMLRKYGANWPDIFADMAHQRIRAWGLNTVANWSDPKVYLLKRTPYTATFGTSGPRIEGSEGWWGKFPDPFSREFSDTIRARAIDQQKIGTANDPWCIGYFVDNELSWGKDDKSLALSSLLSPATQPSKLAMKSWLEKKYGGIGELNKVWGTSFAEWDAFIASTNKPDMKLCGPDLEGFHKEIAEQYFRVIRDAVKAAAPDKLYLGCRIAWGAPSVYRAAAKYCDVVSVNTYSKSVNKDLPVDSDDKPIINGEFHFGALDRGIFHTGLVSTGSQAERAECYRNFLISCLNHPRYVGTHWFQWRDQALTGRGDGENYQIGFLTVTDQPYPELVAASQAIGATMYATRYGSPDKTSAK